MDARLKPQNLAEVSDDEPRLDAKLRFSLLNECREMMLDKLSAIITKALEKMAEELTQEAMKATRGDRQRTLLDAVMLVREQRGLIEQSFKRSFGDVFERRLFSQDKPEKKPAAEIDFASLSLVDEAELDDKIDVDRLIQKARSRLDPQEVLGIRARLGALLDRGWFEENEHPAAPEAIFEALKNSMQEIAPSNNVRNALLDAFEPHVTRNLNAIYSNVNTRLVQNRVLPKIRPRAARLDQSGRALPGAEAYGGGDIGNGINVAAGTAAMPGHAIHPAGAGYAAGAFAGGAPVHGVAGGGVGGGGVGAGGVGAGVGPGMVAMPIDEVLGMQQALLRAGVSRPETRSEVARFMSDPSLFGVADIPGDPVPVSLIASINDIQARLQSMQSLPDPAAVAQMMPDLRERAKEDGTPLDQMTVELVSMVFDHIDQDKSLNEDVKRQLMRLQVIAVKAALLDRSFFARRQHPMRQLIDRVTELASDPDSDLAPEGALIVGLREVIDQCLKDFEDDLAVFLRAIDRIDELARQESARRVAEIDAQLRIAERQEAYSIALDDARADMAGRVDEQTPDFVREFLLKWWTPVIARARIEVQQAARDAVNPADEVIGGPAVEHKPNPAGTTVDPRNLPPPVETMDVQALRIAEFLVWSVSPKHPEEVPRLAGMMPKLVRALNTGARAVEVPTPALEKFMNELLEAHAKVISSAKKWQRGQPDPRAAAVRLRSDGSVRFEKKAKAEAHPEPATMVARGSALSSWEKGDRVELVDDAGKITVYKLKWISPARKLYILSRYPKETLTFSAADLAALASADKARIVSSDATVLDTALDELTREDEAGDTDTHGAIIEHGIGNGNGNGGVGISVAISEPHADEDFKLEIPPAFR